MRRVNKKALLSGQKPWLSVGPVFLLAIASIGMLLEQAPEHPNSDAPVRGVMVFVLDLKDLSLLGTEYFEPASPVGGTPAWLVYSKRAELKTRDESGSAITLNVGIELEKESIRVIADVRPWVKQEGHVRMMLAALVHQESDLLEYKSGRSGVLLVPAVGPRFAVQYLVVPNVERYHAVIEDVERNRERVK